MGLFTKKIENKVTYVAFNNGQYGVMSIINGVEHFWDSNYEPHSKEHIHNIFNKCMLPKDRSKVIYANLVRPIEYDVAAVNE